MKSALIIDDHPLFCEALATTLETLCGVATVGRADCLEAALARLGAGPMPSIVLLDLNLPDVSGIDGLVRVVKAAPGVPVLVVSSQADRRVVMLTLGAGAAGFVPKHSHGSVFR
ncbi:MAG: response regulator transcription factor, partial [Pseudomonadota bacterium]